ncbi:MAG: nucleotide exchange factor GrpE [Tepidisphaeraceae bacterium]|jgi:molecular chaperone GrpE
MNSEPTPTNDEIQDQDDLHALKNERASLFDRLARATADFQNARRRLEADKEQAVAFANASLIRSLLPVIDNFERALAADSAKADPATILKGMQIVHDQWLSVLKSQFVEDIAPKPGDAFDPSTMEAIMHQDSDEFPPGSVTQLLQKGYSLHGRTLRPAQVAVSKSE